jgi:hypothetical protein
MGQRLLAWGAAGFVVVGLGVVPLVLERDSYPHSTYPMFSSRRGAATAVDTAVAVGADDQVWRLDPARLAATDEVILAAATVSRHVGAGTSEVLCDEIAGRVATDGPSGAIAVEVVTERFDAVAWFRGERTPLDRVVHARCEVRP